MDQAGSATDTLAALRNAIREICDLGLFLPRATARCRLFLLPTPDVFSMTLRGPWETMREVEFIHSLVARLLCVIDGLGVRKIKMKKGPCPLGSNSLYSGKQWGGGCQPSWDT